MISVSDEVKLRAEMARDLYIMNINKGKSYTMGNQEHASWMANCIVDDAIKKSLNIELSK